MIDCCKHSKYSKKCIDNRGKIYNLPRRFSRHKCLNSTIRGFTMRASCTPYNNCKKGGSKKTRKNKTKNKFLFNPNNPDKSFDVYIDKNPDDTIPIKYTTIKDVEDTIKKLEKLYKSGKYSHKRIWQVGMILYVRLRVLKNKKFSHYKLSQRYFKFLSKRTKIKDETQRKQLKFKF